MEGVENSSEDVTTCGEEHIIPSIAPSMLFLKSGVDRRLMDGLNEDVAAEECPFSGVSVKSLVEASAGVVWGRCVLSLILCPSSSFFPSSGWISNECCVPLCS